MREILAHNIDCMQVSASTPCISRNKQGSNAGVMARRLRRSRTKATRAMGVPTLPDSVAGVPIVITDSLGKDDA